MTWSILARDEDGRFGVAIASRFFAVGALCVHTRRGVGALSTQALMNPLYGPSGMQWLAEGAAPSDVVTRLTQADAGRAHRQVHVLDAKGASAAHNGSECIGWCGHLSGAGFSVAGNMLVGEAVIEASAAAYRASAGQPLAERLIAAMAAGQAQGGDKRGQQSAALRIHAEEDYPALDIRVDDHAEPIEELHRLYLKSLERFQPFVACLAGRLDPVGLIDRAAIEETVLRFQAAQAARGAPAEPESAPR